MNKIEYKIGYKILIVGAFMILPFFVQGQTYFGFQAPRGKNAFYFSLSWQDKQPHLGIGYNFRKAGATYTDIGAELRFPVNEIYKFDNHQIIAGIYKPFKIERTFSAIGVHVRIDKESLGENAQTHYGLAVSYLPTYAYAASLTDGAYNTMAMRATYNPILFTKKKEGLSTSYQGLTGHRVQFGGHLDMHLERTFIFSSDGYATQIFGAKTDFQGKEDESIQFEGNIYIGTAYDLRRW